MVEEIGVPLQTWKNVAQFVEHQTSDLILGCGCESKQRHVVQVT